MISGTASASSSGPTLDNGFVLQNGAVFQTGAVEAKVEQEESDDSEGTTGIHPRLYFKHLKNNLSYIENFKLKRRLSKLEKAFDRAVKNNQNRLSAKILDEVARITRESPAYAKGYRMYLTRSVIREHKYKVRDGNIKLTDWSEYTRHIPDFVVEKKEEAEEVFDKFKILHFEHKDADEPEEIGPEEKEAMKDPILFGQFQGSQRLYFIEDWEDEYCDLTFDELIGIIGDEAENELTSDVEINK